MEYHYFYKITNKINGKFYYGVHNTSKLDDGYFGSGKLLKEAYKKYGIENFEKEILKYFDTMEEVFNYEKEIVNESIIKNENCYNIMLGGRYPTVQGKVTVKDKNGKTFWVSKEEYIYINKEQYKFNWQGKHHKEESKEKTRKTMTPENSKNNRIWVNKNGKVKYLLKIYLDEYLANGWKLGRTGYKPRKNKQGTLL